MASAVNPFEHKTAYSSNQIITDWESHSAGGRRFTIRRATAKDANAIIKVVQEAYFHPRTIEQTQRNEKEKESYGKADVPRRLDNPDSYRMFVCETAEKIIGTVYLQCSGSLFYTDENGVGIPELGMLAVDPEYWGKEKVAHKLVQTAMKEAFSQRVRGVYLIAIGKKTESGEYTNSLPAYYERFGFKHIYNRTSARSSVYINGTVDQVVMLADLSAQLGSKALTQMTRDGKTISLASTGAGL